MKIYTKTGDKGTTSLFGGTRISKDDAQIEAYGTVDELNSLIGLCIASIDIPEIKEELLGIQVLLFNMGSILASPKDNEFKLPKIEADDIVFLERQMDTMDQQLEPLKNFILPSGSKEISFLHLARTVTRRAERRVITIQRHLALDENIVIYLNRLSDYFFILARFVGHSIGTKEVTWTST